MARRPVAASFVLGSLALVAGQALMAQGCTQDFSTFDSTGSGGEAATSSSSTQSTTSTTTTTTTTSTTSTTTTVGPGGGEGGSTTVTTTTGGGGEQGGGGAGPCTDAGDCEDNNPCTTDVCGPDGTCGNDAVADGPLNGADDPDDCQNHDCVAGVLVDEADDTEDPADVNPPCELTVCVGGTPTPDFADDTTSCGPDPQFCDGAGSCIGCDPDPPDNECGSDTECASPTCIDPGICDPGFFDAGTPLSDPTDGDCQGRECTGDAVTGSPVDDPTDSPDDLPCATGSCNGGTPAFTTLTEGTACIGQAGVCDGLGNAAANCHVCRDTVAGGGTDPGCTSGSPVCDEAASGGVGVCRECIDTVGGSGTDDGCTASEVCNPTGNTCVNCYTDGGSVAVNCAVDEVCNPTGNGVCSTCYDTGNGTTDPGCTGPLLACNTGTDACVECRNDADCTITGEENPNGRLCNRSCTTACGCTTSGNPDAACVGAANGPVCSGMGGTCTCTGDPDCTTSTQGDACLNGSPRVCGCVDGTDCTGPNAAGPTCTGGLCGP